MDLGKNKIKQIHRMLKKDPDSYAANLQMGMLLLDNDNVSDAIPHLEKALKAKEDHVELSYILANAYNTLGNQEKSAEHFIHALRYDPDNYDYLYGYGLFLQSTGKPDKAIEVFKEASRIRPDNHELYNDIGVLCFQKQDYTDAIENLNHALEINPGYVLALVNLGYVYLATGNLMQTKKIMDRLEKANPYDPEYLELKNQFNMKSHELSDNASDLSTDLTFSDQLYAITPLKIIKKFGDKRAAEAIGLSIVIPIHNEVDNITILYHELVDVLSKLKERYEILFVNDGSMDGSTEALERIAAEDLSVKIIHFRRNYGQTAAMNAGFKLAQGSVVITMDGDLQNDPADIPRLLEKMAEGYDMVSGWRKNRKDTLITRKIPSMMANRIINKLIEGTQVQLHDFGCTLKAYKLGIVKNIDLYGEMHRFIPVFAAWLGVKVTEIPVNHRPRVHGYAKYNLSRVSRVIFDLIVVRFFSDYMTRPIQFFGKIAKKLLTGGLIFLFILALLSMLTPLSLSPASYIILAALLMFACLQIISIGLLGELMMRSYFEIQKKDSFVVEKITNEKTLERACAE